MKYTTTLTAGVGAVLVLVIIAVVIVIGVAYHLINPSTPQVITEDKEDKMMKDADTEAMMMKTDPVEDVMMKEIDDVSMKEMMTMTYTYSGQLHDVTEGSTIRGITTGGSGSGIAQANFKEGIYDLFVTFENISDPRSTDFYEGWIVRRGASFSVLSTGRVDKDADGIYTNTYRSGEDLTDHDFYVLTIEPDDGNPAPADHIVEGVLSN